MKKNPQNSFKVLLYSFVFLEINSYINQQIIRHLKTLCCWQKTHYLNNQGTFRKMTCRCNVTNCCIYSNSKAL